MNLLLLKQISLISVFAGALMGLVGVVSYFSFVLSIIVLLFFAAAVIITYLKKNEFIGIINVREGCIIGAIIGFVSFIGFSIIFAPVSMLLGWLIQAYPLGFLRFFMGNFGTFVVMIFLLIFIAGISALFNAFTGLVTAYVFELITGIKKENGENTSIDFEIK